MIQTATCPRGMVTAPHHLAAQAGLRVLQDGGNAIEAAIATAATIAVVYPHMNGLGGDNFWLIHHPEKAPVGIDACGGAAATATRDFYAGEGHEAIPSRGPLAALTVAGAVSGWAEAHKIAGTWGGTLPLDRLLEDATFYARNGFPTTRTQSNNTSFKMSEMTHSPGFADAYLTNCPEAKGAPCQAPDVGEKFTQDRLAGTLERLAKEGLDAFYRGALSRSIAADLEKVGSPIRLEDLEAHKALEVTPLSVKVGGHTVFNMPPPTQGLASLILLGVFSRLGVSDAEDFAYVHGLVEATKRAFRVRDKYVTDPKYMSADPLAFLTDAALDEMAQDIDRKKALPWPEPSQAGDTVWFAAMDGEGRAVSMIQSLYWEFGSGCVLPETGITWQNRGTSFSLAEDAVNRLDPGRRPFHTIQPALAHLTDGRTVAYGTMGGEGQPQTQAMVFSRYAMFGQELQQAVTAPRWLLGRTWGAETTTLKIEDRFDTSLLSELKNAGHDVEVVGSFEEMMGHAGGLVFHPGESRKAGCIEGATDPRSDGGVAGF